MVITGIYSTLGVAQPISRFLRDNSLLELSFIVGAFLIGAIVLIHGIVKRKSTRELILFTGIIAIYFLLLVRIESPEERTHLIEYSIVGIITYEAIKERIIGSNLSFAPALLALLLTSIFGTFDELIQYYLPNRVFDYRDILFNILVGYMGIGSSMLLEWIRGRFSSMKK